MRESIICMVVYLRLFVFLSNGQVQTGDSKINLLIHKPNLKIHYIPFKKVIVLDNRFDTSKIYTFETGEYPLIYLRFDRPAKDAIKAYIEKEIGPLQKGDKTLLINIKELQIPNNGIRVKEKYAKNMFGGAQYYNSRDYVRLVSDIYIEVEENVYKKLFDLQLIDFMRPITSVDASGIRRLLNTIIGCASVPNANLRDPNITMKKRSSWVADTTEFNFSKDTSSYTLNMIDIAASMRWSKMPIMASALLRDGIYESFEDFKSDKIAPDTAIGIIFNDKDSLYSLRPIDSARLIKPGAPWGFCLSGNLYKQLKRNVFQKLHRRNNTFEFYIPYSLPDMYTNLSLKENYRLSGGSFSSTGNILFDLAAALGGGVAEGISKKSSANRIDRESVKHDFRNCFIDMDSGDIIY
jgi:hypothetical protein